MSDEVNKVVRLGTEDDERFQVTLMTRDQHSITFEIDRANANWLVYDDGGLYDYLNVTGPDNSSDDVKSDPNSPNQIIRLDQNESDFRITMQTVDQGVITFEVNGDVALWLCYGSGSLFECLVTTDSDDTESSNDTVLTRPTA